MSEENIIIGINFWINIRPNFSFTDLFHIFSGIFSSINEIYNTDGILGFFSGLVPRLLGEIILTVLVNTCVFLTRNAIKDEEIKKFSGIPIAVGLF